MKHLIFGTALFLATTLVWGADSIANSDAASVFARFKALAGTWQTTDTKGSVAKATYEITAGGSAVLERFSDPSLGPGNDMVTVYYLDGDKLRLTHYCMAQNQPHMQAQSFDSASGEVRFSFVDATGLSSPDAGHMHSARFRFVDANHFATEWQFYESGKPKFTENVEYTRVQ
jgi:hypothetical protein